MSVESRLMGRDNDFRREMELTWVEADALYKFWCDVVVKWHMYIVGKCKEHNNAYTMTGDEKLDGDFASDRMVYFVHIKDKKNGYNMSVHCSLTILEMQELEGFHEEISREHKERANLFHDCQRPTFNPSNSLLHGCNHAMYGEE